MTETRVTACNRDCPDACVLHVRVEAGRAVALRGDPDDPVTRGFLCERTGRFLARQHDPGRFLRPQLRRDGRLVPVSWDEALDHAARRLLAIRDASGPAAIMHYRSGGSLGLLKHLADHLFESFGPVTIKHGDICSGGGEAAQLADFGQSESHDLFDLRHSRSIVLWGKNVHVSNVHLLPLLREARARGASIVSIDPVRTRASELADLVLQPRPGADFALALGVARALFDRGAVDPRAAERCDGLPAFRALAAGHTVERWAALADVAPAGLLALAERYACGGPTATLVGWGLARRANGAATVRAIDALAAIGGHLGVPGGGVSYYFGRRTAFDTDFVRGAQVAPRTLSEPRLGAELLAARDPPVRALWVTAGNPVSMLPDSATVARALQATEFVVVVDTHPTDTTDLAHLVLPTLTLLEDDDLLGSYGHHWLRESRAALPAPDADHALDPHAPGPRHELHILQGLAERLGVGPALAGTIEEWKRRFTARLEAAGCGLERLRAGSVRNPFAAQVLYADGRVPTPSGRVQLLGAAPPPPPAVDARWPLLLLACSTPRAQSSQWSVALPEGPADVHVHPESAAGLPDGAHAALVSRIGRLAVRVRHEPSLRRDVARMEKGGMLRDGRCANLLVSAVETDLGAGAAYYDERVRLEPA